MRIQLGGDQESPAKAVEDIQSVDKRGRSWERSSRVEPGSCAWDVMD